METKLTVRLDDALIEGAKRRARARKTSLSRLIADLLSALEGSDGAPEAERTPRVTALQGALRGVPRHGGGAVDGERP